MLRASLRFPCLLGPTACNFPCRMLTSPHAVSMPNREFLSNIWSEDLNLVDSAHNSRPSVTAAQGSRSKPNKLRRSRSKKDLNKDSKAWTWELWAANPEDYDPLARIQQMRSSVLISQQSKIPLNEASDRRTLDGLSDANFRYKESVQGEGYQKSFL